MFKAFVKKNIQRYKQLPVVIHPLFVLFGAYCCVVGLCRVFFCYTLSAILHEFGHFIVAKKCGYKMVQVRLMPYGAELGGDLDQFVYNDEIKIAVAGPLTSFVIALILVAMWWVNPNCYEYTFEFCVSNIVCAVFNILPIFPLDGGRVLVAILSKRLRRADAVRYAKTATQIFAIILFIVFLLSFFYTLNLSFGLVSIMLFASSSTNSTLNNYLRINFVSRNKNLAKGLEVVELVVGEDTKVYKVYSKLKSQKFYKFTIVDNRMNIKSTIDELVFDGFNPEDFKKTFGEISLLKYNKNIEFNR